MQPLEEIANEHYQNDTIRYETVSFLSSTTVLQVKGSASLQLTLDRLKSILQLSLVIDQPKKILKPNALFYNFSDNLYGMVPESVMRN